MTHQPVAIIDIGSNSVRLVVYSSANRIPSIVFNEKVMAGLGRGVLETGALSPTAQERALMALRRFAILIRQMEVRRTRVVATAAVRDASNCAEFLEKVRETGFEAELLSGQQEGYMAGQGVLSAIPEADGIVGDLGGGSLELVEVSGGKVQRGVSLPLGVLRIAALAKKGPGAAEKRIAKLLDESGVNASGRGRPFYMVGGSWRALARLDMVLSGYPLPITHHYRMATDRPATLRRAIGAFGKSDFKAMPSLSTARIPALPHANLMLEKLAERLRPSEFVVSSFGIREGLLYDDLDEQTRCRDPFIEATRAAGRGLGRFAQHGELLNRWISPLFKDDPAEARLRLAACLLADVAWQANPDFRAERGVDMALHGNWVGIEAPGRVMVAQALFCNFGGGGAFADLPVAGLCSPEDLKRACQWGLAMRLGQRLSGGVADSLERSRLRIVDGVLRLELKQEDEALFGEAVERRFHTLATALGCPCEAVAV